MSERVTTPLCRAAWTQNVFTPKEEVKTDPKTGQGRTVIKYGCQLVFDQSSAEGLQAMMDAAFRVGVEAFGENFWAMVQQGSIRWPFRNGGEINPKTGQPRYEQGTTFINVSSGSPIDVVSRYCDPADPQRKPLRVTDPTQLWPGQFVKASVTFKEYRNPQWGVACYINGLQLWHEGERWGDSFDAQATFDAEGELPTGSFGGQAPATSAPAPAATGPSAAPTPTAPPSAPGAPNTGPSPAPTPGATTAPAGPTAPGAPQAAPAAPTPTPTGGGGSGLL
jgi:hypothetical protein